MAKAERNPLSGGNGKHSRSDSLSPVLYIDNKHRKTQSVFTTYKEIKKLAAKESKVPVLTLTEHRSHGYIVCVHSDHLIQYCKEFLKIHGHTIEDPDG
jgi:hypothetical protein